MLAVNGIDITGGEINAGGAAVAFGSATAYAPGGRISLDGGAGNVVVAAAATWTCRPPAPPLAPWRSRPATAATARPSSTALIKGGAVAAAGGVHAGPGQFRHGRRPHRRPVRPAQRQAEQRRLHRRAQLPRAPGRRQPVRRSARQGARNTDRRRQRQHHDRRHDRRHRRQGRQHRTVRVAGDGHRQFRQRDAHRRRAAACQ